MRGAGAGSHDALLYVLVPVSGVVIFYTKSDKNTGWGSILDNLAKDNKDNRKFYLYLYLR